MFFEGPTLLFLQGRFLPQAMKRERVTEAEVRAAVRGRGVDTLQEVLAVVLQTDGGLNVIGGATPVSATALADVQGVDPARTQAMRHGRH